MIIHRAYKTKLKVNNRQRATLSRCAGTARYVYNWALADRIERYEAGNPTNYYEQKKRFNALKDELCPWVREVPYTVTESAFRNLDTAYQNFFRRVKQGKEKPGFPKFKSRSRSAKSFTVRNVRIESDRIRLPSLGWIRLAESDYLPIGTFATEAVTISEKAGEWFVSIQVEVEIEDREGHKGAIGVDLGVKSLAVCSNGTVFDNPHTLAKYEKQLARLQRELARRERGSNNRAKTKAKIAKLYAKIANIRAHTQHDISRHVTANTLPEVVVIEDLNVKGMMRNHCLAKAVSDAGMGELARQIEYKATWNGVEVIKANRWFPSSKTCSQCGCIKDELTLADRVFVCEDCGLVIDRDLNAAINLAALGKPVINGGLPVELGPTGSTVKQEAGT
jgi:putative transposase